jgi:hypothetical protein
MQSSFSSGSSIPNMNNIKDCANYGEDALCWEAWDHVFHLSSDSQEIKKEGQNRLSFKFLILEFIRSSMTNFGQTLQPH